VRVFLRLNFSPPLPARRAYAPLIPILKKSFNFLQYKKSLEKKSYESLLADDEGGRRKRENYNFLKRDSVESTFLRRKRP